MTTDALPVLFYYVVLDHRGLEKDYRALIEQHPPGAENDTLATWSFMAQGARESLFTSMEALAIPEARVSTGCWDPIVLSDDAWLAQNTTHQRLDSWLVGHYKDPEFVVWVG